MANIWFYTLSTSAQVLAALAGLFAVFVVWRVQDFESNLSEARYAVIKIISGYPNSIGGYEAVSLEKLYLMSDLEILNKFSDLLIASKSGDAAISGASHHLTGENTLITYTLNEFTELLFRKQVNKKNSILENLKYVLIVNFLVISLCIVALTFSDFVCSKLIVLTIISALVMFCLYLIGSRIYRITSK